MLLQTHLPGYVSDREKLAAAGAEVVVCTSVNDVFVMAAWGEQNGAQGKVCTHATWVSLKQSREQLSPQSMCALLDAVYVLSVSTRTNTLSNASLLAIVIHPVMAFTES